MNDDHGPIQDKYRETMNAVAEGLDEIFNGPFLPGIPKPRRVAFVLLTSEFGKIDDGRVNYISNGERSDMITMLKELLARFEGRIADEPDTRQ